MTTAMRSREAVYVASCNVGRGVFATRSFPPGAFILDFHGSLITASHSLNHSDQQGNLLQVGDAQYILPDPPGLFVNHACEPNAGIRRDTTLVALRAIRKDEEIRFDYSTTMDEEAWTMQCLCGAPSCRGVIRDFKYLPPTLRERYLALGIVPGFIARQWKTVP